MWHIPPHVSSEGSEATRALPLYRLVLKLEIYRSFNDGGYIKIADCDPKPPAYVYEICNSPISSSDHRSYIEITDDTSEYLYY
ncbi:hypothetical protein H6762_02770 [Candidatus Nomurabacteria bacterium]|uniref:Uncharacterized protein n=1 Tax=Candidatus Dojkabacteria bacterium TaxID=2099670 RepID=A0A955I1E8_9BACT|nr:hypothetical protein [Candidatus Dojkabacteria bacterium]MCB9789884.1 hypothetical protein [Candidatus Nomurabacteria bacterium]